MSDSPEDVIARFDKQKADHLSDSSADQDPWQVIAEALAATLTQVVDEALPLREQRDAVLEQISALRNKCTGLTRDQLIQRITAVTAPEWKAGFWLGDRKRELQQRINRQGDQLFALGDGIIADMIERLTAAWDRRHPLEPSRDYARLFRRACSGAATPDEQSELVNTIYDMESNFFAHGGSREFVGLPGLVHNRLEEGRTPVDSHLVFKAALASAWENGVSATRDHCAPGTLFSGREPQNPWRDEH